MAQKNRKRVESKSTAGASSPRAEVERLIQKEWFKDAVKQGKLCYRGESTPENHRLLEKAYFLRARQLLAEGMPTAAAEVAQHLLDFGVTDPELTPEVAPLLIKVGLTGPAMAMSERLDSPEAQSKLMLTAADQAVLHPERASSSLPEIRQGALIVREALEALDAGDETGAIDRLRDIARNSPFADWRYFTRGLAASRRGDAEQLAANWDRLDPERSAARIARFLRGRNSSAATSTPIESDGSGRVSAAITPALETQIFGEPILDRLERLQQMVAEDRWTEALRLVAPLRFALRRVDPRLAERLTQVLLPSLVNAATQSGTLDDARQLVDGFTRLAEPLPIDPHWRRLWALIWEGPQAYTLSAIPHWRNYLVDLDHVAVLTPEERTRAQALVWKHMAKLYIYDAEIGCDDDEEDGYDDDFDDRSAPSRPRAESRWDPESQKRAVACLEESIRINPAHLKTHETLIAAYAKWDQLPPAVAATHRLLEAFPEHFETLMFLAHHYLRLDDGAQALPYATRARRLKPLDRAVKLREFSARASIARRLAIENRCDEARAELARAEETALEVDTPCAFLARKAAVELKDGQEQRVQQLIDEAQRLLPELTPFWLALVIEATRCELPKTVQDRFEHQWQVGLAKKCKAETAALLAGRMDAFLGGSVDYPGRAKHVAEVVDYIKRGSRVKYRRQDLLQVCEFLRQLPKETALFNKMAARGLKNFPDSPFFIHAGVLAEIRTKGPMRVNSREIEPKLQKALAAARASSDPIESGLEDDIKVTLATVAKFNSLPFRAFSGLGGPDMPKGLAAMAAAMAAGMGFMDEDEYEDEDDYWDDDDGAPPTGRRRPAHSGAASPGPKRKKP